tara:strand:- start:1944 stop:2234 length:291 start_codon:yes stop_codon:yes gene_type:complete
MIEIDTVSSIGSVLVNTQNFRGHPPEYWAERATERICGISEFAEGHVRQQAEEYRLAIYNTILYYIQESINSEKCTMRNKLSQQGHEDLAKILSEL